MFDRARKDRPLVVQEPEVTRSLLARFQIAHLLQRYPERHVWALFMFLNGFAKNDSMRRGPLAVDLPRVRLRRSRGHPDLRHPALTSSSHRMDECGHVPIAAPFSEPRLRTSS